MIGNGFHARVALAGAAAATLLALPAAGGAKPAKVHKVKVMTRNLYLGADLAPGVNATSLQGLVDGAGKILHDVDTNTFAVRARGLAAEVQQQRPDLVGLQEAALWRTAPCTEDPIPPTASHVRYDYLKLLLDRINRGRTKYRLAIAKPEFDFEVWANTDGNEATHAPGCPLGSEINGRLTMRDAILVRRGVQTTNARAGRFKTLVQLRPGGVPFSVNRGWTRVDARVPGARPFRFVNVHLESFDSQAINHTNRGTDVGRGGVREAQAEELFARGGPATGRLPVVLAGDFNSDNHTRQKPGDQLAYVALLHAGFAERSAIRPFGCCLHASIITARGGGHASDFNHKVDHVMTNAPRKIRLVASGVTGRRPANGFWDSDHAGLWSTLRIP